MPGLRRSVAREQPRRDLRRQRAATGRAAPVMNPSRTTGIRAARGGQDEPDEGRDLQPADGRQDAHRIGRVGRVAAQGLLDRGDLARPRRIVEAGPAAGHVVRADAGQGRRSIALAAVVLPIPISPIAEQLAPSAAGGVRDAQPDPDGRHRLVPGHRRPVRQVRGPGPDPRPTRRPPRPGVSAAGMARATPTSMTASAPRSRGEHVDRGSAGQEVGDHLGRHLGRIGGHAAGARPRGRRRRRRRSRRSTAGPARR